MDANVLQDGDLDALLIRVGLGCCSGVGLTSGIAWRCKVSQLPVVGLELVEHGVASTRCDNGLLLARWSCCTLLDIFLFQKPKLVLEELKVVPRHAWLPSRAPLVQQALAIQPLNVNPVVE